MKTKRLSLALIVAISLAAGLGVVARAALSSPDAVPLGTTFTYQGRLTDADGRPVVGPCDLRFGLWDDPTAGCSIT